MALTRCPNCGEQISNTSKQCPKCNADLGNYFACPECGSFVTLGSLSCPECGYSFVAREEKKNKKGRIIGFAILIAVALFAFYFVKGIMWQATFNSAYSHMIENAQTVEVQGGLIVDVWRNTIWQTDDATTNPYTKTNGAFNEDFDDSLGKLYESPSFKSKTQQVFNLNETVKEEIKSLNNPPAKHKQAYQTIMNVYDEYNEFVNMVLYPSGSLNSYTERFNNLDSRLANDLNALMIYYE